MLSIQQFRDNVIVPTLKKLDMYSPAAVNLLLGTVVQESGLYYIVQVKGPAKGVFQIEPDTHHDIWENFIQYKPKVFRMRILNLMANKEPDDDELITNLAYATAMARLVYFRKPEPLPDKDDIEGLAQYWKDHYNTHLGAGTIAQFILNYKEHVRQHAL